MLRDSFTNLSFGQGFLSLCISLFIQSLFSVSQEGCVYFLSPLILLYVYVSRRTKKENFKTIPVLIFHFFLPIFFFLRVFFFSACNKEISTIVCYWSITSTFTLVICVYSIQYLLYIRETHRRRESKEWLLIFFPPPISKRLFNWRSLFALSNSVFFLVFPFCVRKIYVENRPKTEEYTSKKWMNQYEEEKIVAGESIFKGRDDEGRHIHRRVQKRWTLNIEGTRCWK